MATTPDTDIVAVIDAAVGALTTGTNLFKGPPRGPDTGLPTKAVFCLNSGDTEPLAFVKGGTGSEQRFSGVSIRVRSDPHDFEGGQTLARAVRDAIHHNPTSSYVEFTVRESDPLWLGETDKGCHEWTIQVLMEHLE